MCVIFHIEIKGYLLTYIIGYRHLLHYRRLRLLHYRLEFLLHYQLVQHSTEDGDENAMPAVREVSLCSVAEGGGRSTDAESQRQPRKIALSIAEGIAFTRRASAASFTWGYLGMGSKI